ncbi:unnamed protein product [Chilo suppressalis]|uniref:Nose resistant-to-fluoxetine protein N-terminal domain-containing protein n=1 Tax=Chilo suppressalis TaxID=168631 RepID=A0ABN8BHC4_CHISP|nr:unnamed protein product [Chilo suppressalis]
MWPNTFFLLKVIFILNVNAILVLDPLVSNNALDVSLYENVLDSEECARQLTYIVNDDTMLLMQFLDSGVRTPRGILGGNLRDMGNYFQCLGIKKEVEEMSIEGKYCVVEVPLRQDEIELPSLPILPEIPQIPWPNITWPPMNFSQNVILDDNQLNGLKLFTRGRNNLNILLGDNPEQSLLRVAEDSPISHARLELALCLPKVCSPKNVVQAVTPNAIGNLKLEESFCRLSNDKPWVAADTVAVVIFSLIGLLIILSTGYDVRHSVILEKDPKQANTLYTSFSVYTNSRKFFTFRPNPNALHCLDGVRSIAMLWVILGHSFSTQMSFVPANPLEMVEFMTSFTSLWLTSATITVDTFFMISGLLLVYTTASKLSHMSLIKNLHLFYLNRLLRMFPILATAILMQASFQNRMTDGPYWFIVAWSTNNCRQYWWSTLLYVQNLLNPPTMCLGHAWYLAIDMQLYILSPIVLFWVLGRSKKSAWTALTAALMIVVTASTIYNFLNDFQSSPVSLSRTPEDSVRYMRNYYIFTLPRAAPFFVGMLFGYAIHSCNGKATRLSKPLVALLWTLAGATSTVICISTYYTIQPDWDNQTVDSILNSIMRPAWAASIAWLTFACAKGYGGPINWILSLHIFKILGRLSYAMYIIHYPLVYIINATTIAPIHFSVEYSFHRFMINFTVTVIVSYLVTIFIDLPCTRLIGMVLGGKKDKKINDEKKNDEIRKNDDVEPAIDITNLKKPQIENNQNGIRH